MRAAGETPFRPTAPFQPHSATSREAAEKIAPKLGALHRQVVALFEAAGANGLTDEELQAAGNTRSVLRPRRIELTQRGILGPANQRRKTRAGIEAEVWVLR